MALKQARYDDQLFARCSKQERRAATKASRALRVSLSVFIREAVANYAQSVNDDSTGTTEAVGAAS